MNDGITAQYQLAYNYLNLKYCEEKNDNDEKEKRANTFSQFNKIFDSDYIYYLRSLTIKSDVVKKGKIIELYSEKEFSFGVVDSIVEHKEKKIYFVQIFDELVIQSSF